MNQEARTLLPLIILQRENSGVPMLMSAIGRMMSGEERHMEVIRVWILMMNQWVQLEQLTVGLDRVLLGKWREEASVNFAITTNSCKEKE